MAINELSEEICPDIEAVRKEKLIHFICREDMEALKIGREILKNRMKDLHKTKKDNKVGKPSSNSLPLNL